MLQWLKRAFQPRQTRVVVDDWGVRRRSADDAVEEVAWNNLVEVDIVTTDQGPYLEDVFFVLHGSDGKGCVVPQELAVPAKLLERLQALPDFDNGKVIEAMACAENARFVCWKKA